MVTDNSNKRNNDSEEGESTVTVQGHMRDLKIEDIQKHASYEIVCIFVLDVSRADGEQWNKVLRGLNAFGNDIDADSIRALHIWYIYWRHH